MGVDSRTFVKACSYMNFAVTKKHVTERRKNNIDTADKTASESDTHILNTQSLMEKGMPFKKYDKGIESKLYLQAFKIAENVTTFGFILRLCIF